MSDGRNRPQTACRSGRLQDEGAWDFRTSDRLRMPNTPKSAPDYTISPRRKTIEDTWIQRVFLMLCLAP